MGKAHYFKGSGASWHSILMMTGLVFAFEVLGSEPPPDGGGGKETALRGAIARGERAAGTTARDKEARARFLQVEQFARLPEDQQARQFADFYRKLAPYYMSWVIEGILSTYPANILERGASAAPGGNASGRWADQLAAAAATLTPEQLADKLGMAMWLNCGGRARTRQALERHPKLLEELVREDLAAREVSAVQRGCTMVSDLGLRQFTSNVLALYLADTELSKPARTALVWLHDPRMVGPLLEAIDKDPKSLARHAGLFQGPLAGQPAEPALLKLLDSPEAEVRYHAAYALYECRDPALAEPVSKLAQDKDPRLQEAALVLATRLPDAAFAKARPALAPLIRSLDPKLKLEAVTCFAKRKDLIAGPTILELLVQPQISPGQAVTVIQALGALTDSTFNYNLHNWGPAANAKAIARFQKWLGEHPVMQ